MNETILICIIDRERVSFRPRVKLPARPTMRTETCTAHFARLLLPFSHPAATPGRSFLPSRVDLFQLVLKIFVVGLAAVKFKRFPGLSTILYRLVQRLEHWPVRLLKDWGPIECTATSSCRAGLRVLVYEVW